MDAPHPLLSVVVPVYNAQTVLMRAVRSVQAQTLDSWELILVDDASTDGSLELCRHLAAEDGRIRVLGRPHAGPGPSRNAGTEAACGEYIAFLDADDWVEPEAYARLTAAARDEGADVAFCGYVREFGGPARSRAVVLESGSFNFPADMPKVFNRLFRASYISSMCNKVYRAELLLRVPARLDARLLGEDVVYNLRVFAERGRAVLVGEALYHYVHENGDSLTRRASDGYWDNQCELFAAAEAALAGPYGCDPAYGAHNDILLRSFFRALEQLNGRSADERREHCKAYLASAELETALARPGGGGAEFCVYRAVLRTGNPRLLLLFCAARQGVKRAVRGQGK